MKIYFNALGAITSTDTTDEAIRQGTVGNTIKAYFADKNNSNFVAKLNFTRPDGSKISGLIMTPSPSDSTLYTFVLNDAWYLALAGNATFTIYLYDANSNIVAQGQVTYPIQATDYDDEPTITQTQYDSLLTALAGKLGMPVSSLRVDELPEEGTTGVFYVIHDDEEDDTRFNIYVWNSTTREYIWVGSNELDLNKYYTQEQGDQFESDIDNRVSSVESELSSVAQGSPKGVYATLSDLETAYPTGTTGIYVVSADGHWYYWNGSAWTDGGAYLSTVNAVLNTRKIAEITLENDISSEQLNTNVVYDIQKELSHLISEQEYNAFVKKGRCPTNILRGCIWYDTANSKWKDNGEGARGLYKVNPKEKLYIKTSFFGLTPTYPIFAFANSSGELLTSYSSIYKYFKVIQGPNPDTYYLEVNIPDDNTIAYLIVQARAVDSYSDYCVYNRICKYVEVCELIEQSKYEEKNNVIFKEERPVQILNSTMFYFNSPSNPTEMILYENITGIRTKKFEIEEGKTYFVTTGGKFNTETVSFVAYIDEDNNLIGIDKTFSVAYVDESLVGEEKVYIKSKMNIPFGAKYAYIQCRTIGDLDYNDAKYPQLLSQVNSDYNAKNTQEQIDNLNNQLVFYREVEKKTLYDGKANYLSGSSWSLLSVSNTKTKKYELDLTKEYFVTSGWKSQDAGFPIVVYTDENDQYISYEFDSNYNGTNVAVVLVKQKLTIPSNAKYAYIHCRTIGDLDYSDPIYPLLEEKNTLKEKIDEINVEQSKKEISILFVGNSLTQDGIAYLPYMLKTYYPEISFKFYMWYNGGYTLAQQYQKFINNQACEIFSIAENVSSWSNTSKTMSSILSTYKFDIVCLQEYFNYKESYTDTDLVDFNNCVAYITQNYAGGNALEFVELFHAPKRDRATNIFNLTKQGNSLIMQKTICQDMIPNGIAVYRALSTDLDNLGDAGHLSPDGTHTQEGLPCLLQTYTTLLWLFDKLSINKSIYGCSMRMTTAIYNTLNVPGPNLGTGVITGTDDQNLLAQQVAIKAFKEGKFIVEQNLTEYNS